MDAEMPDFAQRFRTTLDLHEAGIQMMRLKFQRLYPDESKAQIQARVAEWLSASR